MLECCAEPQQKSNLSSGVLRRKLRHGLEQLHADYKDFIVDGAIITDRYYSCVLFGRDGKLLAYTVPLLFDNIAAVQESLDNRVDDQRVVWMGEQHRPFLLHLRTICPVKFYSL